MTKSHIINKEAVTSDTALKQFVTAEAPENALHQYAHENRLPDNYRYYLDRCPDHLRHLPPELIVKHVKLGLELEGILKRQNMTIGDLHAMLEEGKQSLAAKTPKEIADMNEDIRQRNKEEMRRQGYKSGTWGLEF